MSICFRADHEQSPEIDMANGNAYAMMMRWDLGDEPCGTIEFRKMWHHFDVAKINMQHGLIDYERDKSRSFIELLRFAMTHRCNIIWS